MERVRICIVEDEMIIAEDLRVQLSDLGYDVTGMAAGYEEALQLLQDMPPDLALVDIILSGDKDGIDVARYIRHKFQIPVIFLTSHAEKNTVDRAKQVHPDGYLMKPFEPDDLYVAIEIAMANFSSQPAPLTDYGTQNNSYVLKDSIFIKKDYVFIKVLINHIMWIQTYGNYLILFCQDEKHMIRTSMKDFLAKLPPGKFLQVHRSHTVNIKYIDQVEYHQIHIGTEKIPIGRSFVEQIKKELDISL
ncbi:MAG: response regulator transcription factor [Chlorobi bacterium]|nr:response regulator transcription factor [Chlorobiota bacterium]